jgi:amino acid adenylation domain-containing protein
MRRGESVLEAVRRAREASPDAPALRDSTGTITYRALWARAEAAAQRLGEAGVQEGDTVAVRLPAQANVIVVLLAIWLRGSAYLPLDAVSPLPRIARMLDTAGARAIVAQDDPGLGELAIPVISMAALLEVRVDAAVSGATASPPFSVAGHRLAYVLFTSGSTGAPKGVAVGHDALANLLWSFTEEIGVEPGDVVLWSTTLAFDIAGLEIWLPLVNGASVAVSNTDPLGDFAGFAGSIEEMSVTVMQGTPSAWRLLKEANWRNPGIHTAICGGEALPSDLAHWLADAVPQAINAYGPTETTIWSSTQDLHGWKGGPVPIGLPIRETEILVLDESLDRVAEGQIGEIFIGGRGLAVGYVGDPTLTAERFVPNPFDPAGGRIYATGDLGYLDDGVLMYSGRRDRQVKIRGHRVELEELREVLLSHPDVTDAVVTTVSGPDGSIALDAYAVPRGEILLEAVDTASRHRGEAWRETFESNFTQGRIGIEGSDESALALNGWVSAITGDPFPSEDVRSWGDSTVSSVLNFRPSRILEIGAGGGLIALKLAPSCESYFATDLADSAVRRLKVAGAEAGLAQLKVAQMAAHEVATLPDPPFDCVIMTSVIQYFPSERYFRDVIDQLVARLPEGAVIFFGDVRNLDLLREFHLWRAAEQAAPDADPEVVAEIALRRMRGETELLLSPSWFGRYAASSPRVASMEVGPSPAPVVNELTRFRYQAVLVVGSEPAASEPPASRRWGDGIDDARSLADALDAADDDLLLEQIPDPRTAEPRSLSAALQHADPPATMRELRQAVGPREAQGLDPGVIASLARARGFDVRLCYPDGEPDRFDAYFDRGRSTLPHALRDAADQHPKQGLLVKDPSVSLGLISLRRRLAPQLREHLRDTLPSFMIPQRITFLAELPVLPNGKLDHKALYEVGTSFQGHGRYAAPSTATEITLSQLWGEILESDKDFGREDDFRDLGGHSLSAARLASRIRETFGIPFELRLVFEHSTLKGLAVAIDARQGTRDELDLLRTTRAERIPLSRWRASPA